MAMREESPVIVLPQDPELVEKLYRKLEEYKGRIQTYYNKYPNQYPNYRDRQIAGNIAQAIILERVLEEKHVVAWDASKEFVEEYEAKDPGSGSAFADGWARAWPVIADYCETGGVNISRGTGLR